MKILFLKIAICLTAAQTCKADLIDFVLGSSLNGNPSIDGLSLGTLTVSGVTATFSASSGTLNATATNFGVNASPSGDITDQIDAGSADGSESITIWFDQSVIFQSLSLSSYSTGEQALLNIAGANFDLPAMTAGLDFYTFSNNNSVALGQTVVLSHLSGNGFSFESFQVSTVPEPRSVFSLTFSPVFYFFRRRRQHPFPSRIRHKAGSQPPQVT